MTGREIREGDPGNDASTQAASGSLHRRSLVISVVLALVATLAALAVSRADTDPPPVPEARVDWGMVMTLRMYPPQGVSTEEARVWLTSELTSMAHRADAAGTEVVGGDGDRITVRLPGAGSQDEAISFLFPWSPLLNADVDPHDPAFLEGVLADRTPAEQEALRAQWEAARDDLLQRIFVAPLSSERYGVPPTIRALPVVPSPESDPDAGGTTHWHRLVAGRFDGVDYQLVGGETHGDLRSVAMVGGADAPSGPDRQWNDGQGSDEPLCPHHVGTPRVVVCEVDDDMSGRTVVHRSFGRVQPGVARITVRFAGVTRDAVIEDGWWLARIDVTATPTTLGATPSRITAWDADGNRLPITTGLGEECCGVLPWTRGATTYPQPTPGGGP